MSTLGARLGLAAMRELGVGKADQFVIKAVYYTANCGLDGVQYVTGCTLGNGNIACEDQGRARLRLSMRDGSRGVTVTVSEAALARFGEHRELRAAMEDASRRREPPDRLAALKGEMDESFRALTDWVQSAPEDELIAKEADE